jgi:hypothetical protein
MARCASCGAGLRWVTLFSGKRMPLDVEPHEDGNIDVDGEGVGHVVKEGERHPGSRPLYRSHFASCKFASRHRKGEARRE